jgi:SsrA-binding protein
VAIKVIAKNRKAYFEYEIGETFEAGIVLTGMEVKSLRDGLISLKEAWVAIDGHNEAILKQAHINPYSHSHLRPGEYVEMRPRKLLLRKRQINQLAEATQNKGVTIVPTQIYFKDQLVKVEIALATGKKQYDKRERTKEREAQRTIARAIKEKR